MTMMAYCKDRMTEAMKNEVIAKALGPADGREKLAKAMLGIKDPVVEYREYEREYTKFD